MNGIYWDRERKREKTLGNTQLSLNVSTFFNCELNSEQAKPTKLKIISNHKMII